MKRKAVIISLIVAASLIAAIYYIINAPKSVSHVALNQSKYHQQYIKVEGQVGKVFSVAGVGGYTITDGEKSLGVIFKTGSSPNQGDNRVVTGQFFEAYNFFGKRQGVIIEGGEN